MEFCNLRLVKFYQVAKFGTLMFKTDKFYIERTD